MDKNSKIRGKLIQQQEERLKALSKDLQTRLFNALMRDSNRILSIENGRIVSTGNAVQKVASSTVIQSLWDNVVGRDIARFFNAELKELTAANTAYFGRFKDNRLPMVTKIVEDKIKRISTDFLNNYRQSEAVALRIKQLVLSSVQTGVSVADLRKAAQELIGGTDEKLGILENYNLVQTRLQDQFSDYDRLLQNEYATALQLNYAIYQGGIIGTSRSFCEDRNSGVYNRETILSWQSEDWQGKKKGHNILVDAGGYNCRHYFDWISYEMAKQLNPDIQKSVFDIPKP